MHIQENWHWHERLHEMSEEQKLVQYLDDHFVRKEKFQGLMDVCKDQQAHIDHLETQLLETKAEVRTLKRIFEAIMEEQEKRRK